ncbi:hypothetical protein D6D21_02616 [Aureobasidium pullulans]|uniref:DUF7605 domain-containing protein n=1 Tax=Aureobasidium pullulans TaxID=5580 RepID=A0AB74J4X1_AURPU|nr:hypothetical protein D6D21_02616 [Aureobasidium pullulans]
MTTKPAKSEMLEVQGVLGKRKRMTRAKVNDRAHDSNSDSESDGSDDSDGSSDSDSDDDETDAHLLPDSPDAVVPEIPDVEPEQGEVLWSEDQEDLPCCAAYHEDVSKFQSRITEILDQTASYLSEIANKGESMERLHAQAIEIREFPEPKIPVVALVGDAGAGEVVSVLLCVYMANQFMQGNFGVACTCVIAEYRRPFPGQTTKFAATVEFLSIEQITTLLRAHIKELIFYNFEEEEDWTHEEKKGYRAASKTAESTFLALFRGKPSFETNEEMLKYMKVVHREKSIAATLLQFKTWCKELVFEHASRTSSEMITVESAFQLHKALSPILSSSASWSQKPSLWPLVHKVSIGIRGSRILLYITIADMPGLTDTSLTRVNASKDYIRGSDYLWIVAPIARCATDTGVDDMFYEFGDRFSGRITFVYTRIDDAMKPADFYREYQKEAQPLVKLNERLTKASSELSQAKQAANRVVKQASIDERTAIVERCQAKYNKLNQRCTEFMVSTRNRKITEMIYSEKAEYLKKGETESVYPVSSRHYAWLKGYKESNQENVVQLSPEMTGIPRLRKHALRIPAPDMWSTIVAHIKGTSVGFIKALRIWATKNGSENDNGMSDLRKKSLMAVGKVAWNDKLMQPAVKCINPGWDQLILREKKALEITQKAAYNALSVIQDGMKETMELLHIPTGHFEGHLDAKKHSIAHVFEKYSEALNKDLKYLKHCLNDVHSANLTEKDSGNGYFARAMRPIYTDASQISGPGYKKNVTVLLQESVGKKDDNSPFIKMANLAVTSMATHAADHLQELKDDCNGIYNDIFNQFGSLVDETVDEDGTIAKVKLALREFLVGADKEIGTIIERLEAIEKNQGPAIKVEVKEEDVPKVKRVRRSKKVKVETQDDE